MTLVARSLRPHRPPTAFEQATASVNVAPAAAFAVLLGTLHLIEPEYEPTWRFVSEYALALRSR